MGNVNMEASQINYRGGQKKMSVEEALKNTSGEAAAIAQLQTDVLNLNSNKANQITIAPFFNAETAYDPGDLVYYNGLSYRCVNAHEGEWDADDFAATTVANELDTLKSGLTPQENFVVINSEVIEDTSRWLVYKVGRTVFVSVSYAPKSGAIVSGAIIASQLPIPIQAWQLFDGITQLILDTDGSLKFWYPSDTTTLTRRDFTFSYVSAN